MQLLEQTDIFVKDPNTFICNNRSPIEDRHFSSSKPHIPLTHIFCGEINKGKAQGYHALSIPKGQTEGVPPPSARNDEDLIGMIMRTADGFLKRAMDRVYGN